MNKSWCYQEQKKTAALRRTAQSPVTPEKIVWYFPESAIILYEIENTLSEGYIIDKCRITLKEIIKFKHINEVIFSGINPHNGENGLISDKDKVLDEVILILHNVLTTS